ncbi:CCR4-NOT core DEDD RNase subunit [Elasticomyces elasticus]|nr:CCR4-NOT core DEDD RNase subunit [Elasticomyces elasticus]
MAPTIGRMHSSQPSNPFANLNNPPMAPSSHYQQHNPSLSQTTMSHPAFGASNLNGGINPFAPAAGGMGSIAGNYGGGNFGVGDGTGLASDRAKQGFRHGAALQEQQQHQAEAAQMGIKSGAAARIREVWKSNLEQEMGILRQLIMKYPFVSMDTEFPGIVARPIGNFTTKSEYHYQTLRVNVDLLKLIQLGITVWTPEGELPPMTTDSLILPKTSNYNNLMFCPCTWSFNFQFSLDDDMYAEGSVDVLKKAGIDFVKHQEMGIEPTAFGSLLTTSGLTYMEDVHWLSFHSGYDFGYLVKILSGNALPEHERDFRAIVNMMFPKLWDIKYLLRHAQRLQSQGLLGPSGDAVLKNLGQRSALQDLADELQCHRVGIQHTAGSDSWLTGMVFWQMRHKIFDNNVPEELSDSIYGLHGAGPPASQEMRDAFIREQAGQQTPQQTNGTINYHTGLTPNAHGGPSTPTGSHTGLASTPGPQHHYQHGGGLGAMSGFGNFQYGKAM